MMYRAFCIAAAALVATSAPAAAGPGDQWRKRWEKRAECDKKLHEAKSRRDFYQKIAECDRELAKLDREQRREAAKEWREVNGSGGSTAATMRAAILAGTTDRIAPAPAPAGMVEA